jgi:hypothetical protein
MRALTSQLVRQFCVNEDKKRIKQNLKRQSLDLMYGWITGISGLDGLDSIMAKYQGALPRGQVGLASLVAL